MFVLDTNVISEPRHGKANPSLKVRMWAAQQQSCQLFLTAISILELEKGVLSLERKTPPQGRALRTWLAGAREIFKGCILPFTDATAVLCAALHVPNPRPDRDAMIAASGLEHRFAVVTRNVTDFRGTGLTLVNPWDAFIG